MIRYFDRSSSVVIPSRIEILCELCFAYCTSLTSVTFESNSKLHRIEESAVKGSGLTTIELPASVEVAYVRGLLQFSRARECQTTRNPETPLLLQTRPPIQRNAKEDQSESFIDCLPHPFDAAVSDDGSHDARRVIRCLSEIGPLGVFNSSL
jgi:hypothetical protein